MSDQHTNDLLSGVKNMKVGVFKVVWQKYALLQLLEMNGFEPLGTGMLQKSYRTWSNTTRGQNFASICSGYEESSLRSQAYCQNEVVMQLYARLWSCSVRRSQRHAGLLFSSVNYLLFPADERKSVQ